MATGHASRCSSAPTSRASSASRATGTTPRAGRTSGVDLAGQRVGIIGTGSTGIQAATGDRRAGGPPAPSSSARPNFSLPARNRPARSPTRSATIKAHYAERRRQARESFIGGTPGTSGRPARSTRRRRSATQAFEARWQHRRLLPHERVHRPAHQTRRPNEHAAEFVRAKIRETVDDPARRRAADARAATRSARSGCASTPGTSRSSTATTSARRPARARRSRRSRRAGIRAADEPIELDVAGVRHRLRRHDRRAAGHRHPRPRRPVAARPSGRTGPRTYLGLAAAGFPNLFIVTGPGSPSVLSNMVVSIEQHVELDRRDCIAPPARPGPGLRSRRRRRPRTAWVAHRRGARRCVAYPRRRQLVQRRQRPRQAARATCPTSAAWGSTGRICDGVAAAGYEGFALAGPPRARPRERRRLLPRASGDTN